MLARRLSRSPTPRGDGPPSESPGSVRCTPLAHDSHRQLAVSPTGRCCKGPRGSMVLATSDGLHLLNAKMQVKHLFPSRHAILNIRHADKRSRRRRLCVAAQALGGAPRARARAHRRHRLQRGRRAPAARAIWREPRGCAAAGAAALERRHAPHVELRERRVDSTGRARRARRRRRRAAGAVGGADAGSRSRQAVGGVRPPERRVGGASGIEQPACG